MPRSDAALEVTEITSANRVFPDLAEVWRHRALAIVFAQRNVKLRFKQTLLGRGWMLIQPILLSGVLTLFLGTLLAVPSEGVPYAVFAFTGTAIWTMFQRAVSEAGTSLTASGNLLSKVYFPRLIIPLSTILTASFDFLPVYALAVIMVCAYGLFPGWPILLSPLFALVGLAIALAIGLWISALDSLYRDVRLFVTYGLQLGIYISPVMYPTAVVPAHWRTLYMLNPLTGLIQGFRWSMVAGISPPDLFAVAWAVGLTAVLLASGLTVFARLERFVVDRI
jgi:lipopolysaccharide transport system permease protein